MKTSKIVMGVGFVIGIIGVANSLLGGAYMTTRLLIGVGVIILLAASFWGMFVEKN